MYIYSPVCAYTHMHTQREGERGRGREKKKEMTRKAEGKFETVCRERRVTEEK